MINSRCLYGLVAIFAFAPYSFAAEPAAKRPFLDDVLQQPAKLEFKDATLERVAEWLAGEYRINVLLHGHSLRHANIRTTTSISGKAEADTLGEALTNLLGRHELGWISADDILFICSREEAELDYFTPPRVYRLREGGDMTAFCERLKREYAPKTWKASDNPRSQSLAYIFMDRALILNTTSVHFAAIEKRYAKELVRCRASEDSSITPAVERKIDVAFHDAKLSAVADWFARELKIKVELDKDGLKAASIGTDTLIRLPALRQVPVATALDLIAGQHGLGWHVECSHFPSLTRLVITSRDESLLGEREAHAFDVRELVDDGDVDGLMDLLVSAIQPDNWKEGTGPPRDLLFVAPGYLIVSNSYAIQREIARFLSELRCAVKSK